MRGRERVFTSSGFLCYFMHMIRKPILFLYLFLALGCARKEEPEQIELPPISDFTIESNWGVVASTYLRMRERPEKKAPLVRGLTRGMIVQIISSGAREETIEDETAYWYNVSVDGLRGWAFGAYLKVFNSLKEAENFAGEL